MKAIVGMADMQVLKGGENILVTYSLGSCIAVAACDPSAGIGGLLHFMLPDSGLDQDKATRRPCMFADTGIELLLAEIGQHGARRARLTVKLAGGAQVLDQDNFFAIGHHNYTAARRLLWEKGLQVVSEDVGGTDVRSVEFELATARLVVKTANGQLRVI